MFYCEGKYCSKRNTCAHHQGIPGMLQEYLDMSTQGTGYYYTDENGKPCSEVEHWCGDSATYYKHYINSEGRSYDEYCVSCEYRRVCSYLLEIGGSTHMPGKRICFANCEEIKANSEFYKQKVEAWLGKPIEE